MRIPSLIIVFCLFVGCDSRIETFEPNEVFSLALAKARSTSTDLASQDTSRVVEDLYGTPDEPRWPESPAAKKAVVDERNLFRASGPVSSEKDGTHVGLFREHCVTCHALEGSGAGPASVFQDPYPRDFRHGVFKWKSTERGKKPTHRDIRELLTKGIPGTAMPSFALLAPEDLDALVDYVVFLSTRGEVERRVTAAAIDELDYGDTAPIAELILSSQGDTEGGQVVQELVDRVHEDWAEAEQYEVAVPSFPELSGEQLVASVARGKEFFHGKVANCAGCHGPAGDGSLPTLDYDDWTKDYTTRIGLTPDDREAMKPFRKAGALRPRTIAPRTLRDGVFHGGGDSASLYRRITQGIAGTPMPAVEVVAEPNGKGLTTGQIWDLVRYVQQLSTSQ
ncbi:MAG TPA: cytochrome C [Rhodopirellula sp.]|nr:cytochrome C [Rhodopirellula sp.]